MAGRLQTARWNDPGVTGGTRLLVTRYRPRGVRKGGEPWDRWEPPLLDTLRAHAVDTLLVDGTFYSADELPGRRPETIGHPLMTSTVELLAPLVARAELRVLFTHLNHSNPALTPGSAAERSLQQHGFEVAREGQEIEL